MLDKTRNNSFLQEEVAFSYRKLSACARTTDFTDAGSFFFTIYFLHILPASDRIFANQSKHWGQGAAFRL
ncbi:MAG TPA: hypothetical protein VK608_11820 [Edaphobacter sp.]|nr:hypothetical protein [Edaphobacter sp.]